LQCISKLWVQISRSEHRASRMTLMGTERTSKVMDPCFHSHRCQELRTRQRKCQCRRRRSCAQV
jgi:hypothetical protein